MNKTKWSHLLFPSPRETDSSRETISLVIPSVESRNGEREHNTYQETERADLKTERADYIFETS
jgi:hypothetical protein